MVTREDIPEIAICHKCGQPMKIIDLAPKAAALGVRVPEGSFVINCCDTELTIEDEDSAIMVKELLLAYHHDRNDRIEDRRD